MDRHQLERKLWLALRDLRADRHPHAANIIANMLDAADLYAATREVAFHAALAAADPPDATAQRRHAALAGNPMKRATA